MKLIAKFVSGVEFWIDEDFIYVRVPIEPPEWYRITNAGNHSKIEPFFTYEKTAIEDKRNNAMREQEPKRFIRRRSEVSKAALETSLINAMDEHERQTYFKKFGLNKKRVH